MSFNTCGKIDIICRIHLQTHIYIARLGIKRKRSHVQTACRLEIRTDDENNTTIGKHHGHHVLNPVNLSKVCGTTNDTHFSKKQA